MAYNNKAIVQPDVLTAITGNITAAQAAINTPVANATVVADVTKASNATVFVTGAFNQNFSFDASIDGTNWFSIQAVRTNSNTIEPTTGVLASMPAYGWELSVNAYTHFRVRAHAHTSGTSSWRIVLGVFATEPVPAIQTHPVTGSGNFAVTMAAHATNSPAKSRDAVAGATDVGQPVFLVRRDSSTAISPVVGDYEIPQLDAYGAQYVRERSSFSTTNASVTAAITNVTLLASNVARRVGIIYNDSTATLYVKLGATASTTSYTVKMQPDDYYEVPGTYSGVIDGIWTAANGAARVTEVTGA